MNENTPLTNLMEAASVASILHGKGEKYGALISLPEGEKIIPADVEAQAVAHWAECEAWRAAYKEWSEGDYHFREPTEAREASDRARGAANPTMPPTEGGENPQ